MNIRKAVTEEFAKECICPLLQKNCNPTYCMAWVNISDENGDGYCAIIFKGE